MIKILKIDNRKKPKLKLCPNHYNSYSQAALRRWDSTFIGPARRDGNGWYALPKPGWPPNPED